MLALVLGVLPLVFGVGISVLSVSYSTVNVKNGAICELVYQETDSGFPLPWRIATSPLVLGPKCASVQLSCLNCVSYDRLAFFLDALFYMLLYYAAISLYLGVRRLTPRVRPLSHNNRMDE